MSEKIFKGEQFFNDDLFPRLALDGSAVSAKEYGPFDWQDVKCRLKVAAEIFGESGAGTASGDVVSVTLKGSKDGTNYDILATGTAATGTGTDGNGRHILASGTFLDYVEKDPDYLYGKVVVSVTAGISGATLKVGLTSV